MNTRMKLPSLHWKIRKIDVFTFFVIFVFFPPSILERLTSFSDSLQRYVQLGFIIILAVDLFVRKAVRIPKSHLRWGLYCFYGLILTLLIEPSSTYRFVLRVGLPVFLAVLLCLFYQNRPDGMTCLLNCMNTYWVLLIALNCVTMLLFPDGIIRSSGGATMERANWLLGSKNNVVLPLIFASSVFMFHFLRKPKRRLINPILFFAMVIFSMMWAGSNRVEAFGGSSTGLLALLVFFLMLFLGRFPLRKHLMRLSVGWIAFAFCLLSAVVIWGSIHESSLIGSIFNIVGKDSTASYRTLIWADALERTMESPFWGRGYTVATLVSGFTQTYNMFLDCVYRYGLIGLSLLLFAFGSYRSPQAAPSGRRIIPAYVFLAGAVSMFLCAVVNSIKLEHIIVLLELYVCLQNDRSLQIPGGPAPADPAVPLHDR